MSNHRAPVPGPGPVVDTAPIKDSRTVNPVKRAWNTLCAWNLRGTWKPGSHNIVLLISQVILIWIAAQRGMDYVNTPSAGKLSAGGVPTLHGIEQVNLDLLGYSFLLPAGVAFVSLATGWAKPLSLSHLFIGASYLILGITFLRQAPVDDWLTSVCGASLLLIASFLLVGDSKRIPDVLAISVGIIALTVGGWLAADGLGYGYRTGNGFLGTAVLHFVFGFGTQVLARREARLRREEEEDFRELGAL